MRPSSDAATAPQGRGRAAHSTVGLAHQSGRPPRASFLAASPAPAGFRPPPGSEPSVVETRRGGSSVRLAITHELSRA
eukprot:3462908-Pyramimonas_sp.AAC.1